MGNHIAIEYVHYSICNHYVRVIFFWKVLQINPFQNQTLFFSNLYTYKHDEIYILGKRIEKKLNNL